MAYYGNTIKFAEEWKGLLTNGVDSSFDEAAEGVTPAYGGTDTGEQFEGLGVFCENLNEREDESYEMNKPYIEYQIDGVPVAYFLDDATEYQITATFNIVIDGQDTKSISGETKKKKELMYWYNEQLEYLLSHANLTSVKVMDGPEVTNMNPTNISEENDETYLGGCVLNATILRE